MSATAGGDPDTAVAIALAAAQAVSSLPDEQRELYSAVIESALSESQRRSCERGVADGEARGEVRALLQILAQRGLAITAEQRQRIATCSDPSTLDRWLARALIVSSVESLLA